MLKLISACVCARAHVFEPMLYMPDLWHQIYMHIAQCALYIGSVHGSHFEGLVYTELSCLALTGHEAGAWRKSFA